MGKIVQIEKTTFCDIFDEPVAISSDVFRVQRDFFWQKWRLLDEYGIGYQKGDIFDQFPVKINQEYTVKKLDVFINVKTKVLQE